MSRHFLLIGSLAALVGVALGAFGTHALADRLSEDRLRPYEVGVRYQMIHALALLAVAWVLDRWPSGAFRWAGWLFTVGIVIFSGSLYALALSGVRSLGAITPIGGLAFLGGWGFMIAGALRSPMKGAGP